MTPDEIFEKWIKLVWPALKPDNPYRELARQAFIAGRASVVNLEGLIAEFEAVNNLDELIAEFDAELPFNKPRRHFGRKPLRR
jgi:hypothetical protein